MVKRDGDVVVVTNNDELSRLKLFELRSPIRISFFLSFPFTIINYSNLVDTFIISSVCSNSRSFLKSIVKRETIFQKI